MPRREGTSAAALLHTGAWQQSYTGPLQEQLCSYPRPLRHVEGRERRDQAGKCRALELSRARGWKRPMPPLLILLIANVKPEWI